MRISGSPQMRQSAGNSVAKRLSARTAVRARIAVPTVPVCVARVRSQLLLKTSSHHSEGTAFPELILLSIAVRGSLRQSADARPAGYAFPFWFPYARLPCWTLVFPEHQAPTDPAGTLEVLGRDAKSAGSNPRNEPDVAKIVPKYKFPKNSGAAMHTLQNSRSGGIEMW